MLTVLLLVILVGINVVTPSIVIMQTLDGCPFAFDRGQYGIVYPRPECCKHLLPANANISATPEEGDSPFWLKLYYSTDIEHFILKVSSDNDTPIYDMWITANQVTPEGKMRRSAGAFSIQLHYEYYCCDLTKRKNVVRFNSRNRTEPFYAAEMVWSPLNYVGTILFRANVFITPEKWYSNVLSKAYVMPPKVPEYLQPKGAKSLFVWENSDSEEYYYDY